MKSMYDVFKKPQLWKKCLLLKAVPCIFISYLRFLVSSEQGAALNAKSYSTYCIVWNIHSHSVIVKGQRTDWRWKIPFYYNQIFLVTVNFTYEKETIYRY